MNPIVLPSHTREVTALLFAGDLVVSASKDRTVLVSRLGATKPLYVLKGHLDVVNALAVAGNTLATACDDCGVRLFNLKSGELIALLKGHTSAVKTVVATAAGWVTTSDDGSRRTWGKASAIERGYRAKKPPTRLALGGGATAEACEDGTVRVEKAKRTAVLGGHDAAVTALAAAGELLAVGAANGAIQVWPWREALDAPAPRAEKPALPPLLWSAKSKTKLPDLRFEGGSLWVGRENLLEEYDAKTGKRRSELKAKGEVVFVGRKSVVFADYDTKARVVDRKTGKVAFEFPLEGNYLKAGDPLAWTTERANEKPNALCILDPDKRTVTKLEPMAGDLEEFAFSPDRKLVVVGSSDEPRAWVWDVAKRELLATLAWEGEWHNDLGFTADSTRVVVGARDGRAYVYDARSGQRLHELLPPQRARRSERVPICVSPTGDHAVIWGVRRDHAVLFDLASGRALTRLFGELPFGMVGVTFSPDGKRVIAGHLADIKLAFYDAETGTRLALHEVHRIDGMNIWFRFFNDGQRVVSWGTDEGDKSIRCWDVETGRRRWASLGLAGKTIDNVVLSPKGRFMAVTARESNVVRVIDLATGKTLADLPDHPDYARRPAFSADDKLLATSANSGRVQVWDLKTI